MRLSIESAGLRRQGKAFVGRPELGTSVSIVSDISIACLRANSTVPHSNRKEEPWLLTHVRSCAFPTPLLHSSSLTLPLRRTCAQLRFVGETCLVVMVEDHSRDGGKG